jgi:hypothetical protein
MELTKAAASPASNLTQQLRQLGDIGRDPARIV